MVSYRLALRFVYKVLSQELFGVLFEKIARKTAQLFKAVVIFCQSESGFILTFLGGFRNHIFTEECPDGKHLSF